MLQLNHGPRLYLHAEHGEWAGLISRCESHPEEVSYVDVLGRNTLHRACSRSPPPDAVLALLSADESAAATSDREGKIPLHYACTGRTSPDVVVALIEAHPHGLAAADGEDMWLPLHFACYAAGCGRTTAAASAELIRMLASAHPEGLVTEDDSGRTPLHLACQYGAPPEVIAELLDQGGAAASMLDRRRRSPLHLACTKYDAFSEGARSMFLLLAADRSQAAARDYDGHSCLEILTDTYETPIKRVTVATRQNPMPQGLSLLGALAVYWEKAVLLLDAMSLENSGGDGDGGSGPDAPLHEAIRLGGCPKAFALLCMLVRPDLVRQRDRGGNLPLHAAAAASARGGCPNSDVPLSDGADLSDVVKVLLEVHPTAARELNDGGELPLQLAIECGMRWNHGAGAIYRAHPPALHAANLDFGLLPFFLAFRVGDGLTEMFLTLRSRPDVIPHKNAENETK